MSRSGQQDEAFCFAVNASKPFCDMILSDVQSFMLRHRHCLAGLGRAEAEDFMFI